MIGPELPRHRVRRPAPERDVRGRRRRPRGSIGFSSQSGALGLALLEAAERAGSGSRRSSRSGTRPTSRRTTCSSTGRTTTRPTSSRSTSSRSATRGKFARIARRVSRSKPILALKSGRTSAGARAASSHTAALASSDAAVDALFHQAGVIRADTLEELVDVAGAALHASRSRAAARSRCSRTPAAWASSAPTPARRPGSSFPSLADETRARSGRAPARRGKPREPGRHARLGDGRDATRRCCRSARRPRRRRGASSCSSRPCRATADEVAAAVGRVAASPHDKPVLAAVISAEGIPAALVERRCRCVPLPGVGRARARPRRRARRLAAAPRGAVPELEGIDRAAARRLVDARARRRPTMPGSSPTQARALLDAYGIPLVARARSRSRRTRRSRRPRARLPGRGQDRRRRARTRPRRGGVALDLADEEEVRAAAARIGGAVLVQPMRRAAAPSSSPASSRIPSSGRSSRFGPGGVFAELIGDARFRIAPLTDVDAEELVLDGQGRRARPRATAARPRPTRSRSSTCCTASRGSATTCPRSPSSTSTRCSRP